MKPQNTTKKGAKQKRQRKNNYKHPCRFASEKGPQRGRASSSPAKFRDNPKTPKNSGPRMAPRQNARKKGRTAKTGDDTTTAAKKGTNQKRAGVCGALLGLSCVSWRKDKRRRREPYDRENEPQKGKLDMKRIFIKPVRAPKAKNINKHVGRTPPKTQNHNKTAKTKIRTRKWIFNTSPKGKHKNGKKTLTNLQNKKREKRTAFPLSSMSRAVRFCHVSLHACTTPEQKQLKGPPATKPTATQHELRRKKSGAGGDLGEIEEEGVRVVVDERGQDEETLGETQTTQGLAFPQHLRKKNRERQTSPTNNHNNRKREDKQL